MRAQKIEGRFALEEDINDKSVQRLTNELNNFANNNPQAPIRISLDCIGGDVLPAFVLVSCFEELRNREHWITMHIPARGIASSCAFWLLQNVDERIAHRYARGMFHQSKDTVEGNTSRLRETLRKSEITNKVTTDMIAFRSRLTARRHPERGITALTASFISTQIASGNWFMSAEEMYKYGLLDKVVGPPRFTDPEDRQSNLQRTNPKQLRGNHKRTK